MSILINEFCEIINSNEKYVGDIWSTINNRSNKINIIKNKN